MCELFARPAVRSSSGIVFLFIEEEDYVRPVWPEETGRQFGGNDFVTMFDPAGHPFCLCRKL